MTRKAFYILIFNLLACMGSFAQGPIMIKKMADQHYCNGNFAQAAKEYNRAIFFDIDSSNECLMKIAECYFYLQEYELSGSFFDKAYFSAKSDSVRAEAILGKAYGYVLQKEFLLAKRELFNVESVSDTQNRKYLLLLGTCFYGLANFTEAEKVFTDLVDTYQPEEVEAVKQHFAQLEKSIKWLNPNRAMYMSYVIPGSGQFFIGEVKEGVNAVILIGGLVYLYLKFAGAYSFVESLFVFLPWIQRYWMGGAEKTEKLAIEKMKLKHHQAYNRILQICSSTIDESDK